MFSSWKPPSVVWPGFSRITPNSVMYQVSTIAMDLAIHTQRAPDAMIPAVRSILRRANPEFAHATFETMNQIVEDLYGRQRLAAHLPKIAGAAAFDCRSLWAAFRLYSSAHAAKVDPIVAQRADWFLATLRRPRADLRDPRRRKQTCASRNVRKQEWNGRPRYRIVSRHAVDCVLHYAQRANPALARALRISVVNFGTGPGGRTIHAG